MALINHFGVDMITLCYNVLRLNPSRSRMGFFISTWILFLIPVISLAQLGTPTTEGIYGEE